MSTSHSMSVFTTDAVSNLYSEILNTDFIVIYRACVEVEYNRGLFKLEIHVISHVKVPSSL